MKKKILKVALVAIFAFFAGLLIQLFFSCVGKGSSNRADVNVISIENNNLKSKVYLSEVSSSVKCIPLETNDNALINQISKVISKGNSLYITDGMALYKFDETGTLLKKIKNNGSGPDEYINISDFQIGADGSIWILSRSNKQLYNYSSEGLLLKKISLDYWVSNIYLINPLSMFLYVGNEIDGSNSCQLKILNLENEKVSNEFLPIDSKKAKYLHVKSDNHFAHSCKDNDLYFFQMFNDTIYRFSAGQLLPAYFIDINGNNIPESFFLAEYKNIMDFFQSLSKYSYAYGTSIFSDNKNSYLYSYYYKGECYMAIISKKAQQKTLLFKELIEDVCLSGYLVNLTELGMFLQDNGDLIIPLNPSEIMEYANAHLEKPMREKVKQQLKYIDEDQNPILLRVRMK